MGASSEQLSNPCPMARSVVYGLLLGLLRHPDFRLRDRANLQNGSNRTVTAKFDASSVAGSDQSGPRCGGGSYSKCGPATLDGQTTGRGLGRLGGSGGRHEAI